jgi:hypothetical protein
VNAPFLSFMLRALVVLVCSGAIAACGNAFGNSCGSDADCHSLTCVQQIGGTTADGGCAPGPGFCSLHCAKSDDCASLGPNFICTGGAPCQGVCVKQPPV